MRFWNRSSPSGTKMAIVCTMLAPILSGLAFTGCGTPPPTNGRVEISYWEKWSGFEDDAMQAVVDDFNNSQNRIFVRKLTGIGEIERKLMLATAGGDPPDVAGIWPATITGFSEKGALTPLDKMFLGRPVAYTAGRDDRRGETGDAARRAHDGRLRRCAEDGIECAG